MSIEQTCVVDSFAIFDDYFTYVVLWNLQVIGYNDAITIPPPNYHIILGLRILCQKVNKQYVSKFHLFPFAFVCVFFFFNNPTIFRIKLKYVQGTIFRR